MKTVVEQPGTLTLKVQTTGDTVKGIDFPFHNVHYWYPFNINFTYRYTNSKNFLYLVKERDYEGPNLYNVDILKRTKAMGTKDGAMYNPSVHERNQYIINKAKSLGIPVITDDYTYQDVNKGFKRVSGLIRVVKDQIEARYLLNEDEIIVSPEIASDSWDTEVYACATAAEKEVLQEFGEMYAMLNLMRKMTERG